ncbi:hypothetical protein TPHA_0D01250 [Tetrapisispora phaffii CBS 4417]|uniref:Diacylglycerol O-acyltransferase n=1 Tax=Tetrapisispora phaffii (strain ATCC 24235 / CBS 4417 / NBRC 1672 / NRRL Y-8282 / UCD 70-5) TaxID=1071381 RepID=G8BSE5_TETPH|nr:hypothetical protein TPHA_0D01250 [Tetrapisispora phaffii CBS 4417]CCE62766.1 hypothetical protein TPHA_0D01250 [Tetrapisispora phaffii CBS 4417]
MMKHDNISLRLRSSVVKTDVPIINTLHCDINTPLQRRLQTLACAWHITSMGMFSVLFLLLIAFPRFWIVIIPYMVYYMFDRSPADGNVVKRYSPFFRSLLLWKYYCNYFPISLHKTVDLEPTFNENGERVGPKYIFGYHPHGIGALGAFGAFATEGCNYSSLFPGIPISLMTLVTQFHIPIYRDYLMALGITSVSRKNALKVLGNDQSICIVIGGAMESLLCQVNKVDLVIKKRKGFVKLAITSGNTHLVPVFSFGETNSYKIIQTKDGSFLRNIQLWIKETFSFTIPFFYARGVFNYDFGLLPFRTPMNIVVGKPIIIKEFTTDPSNEMVDYYHDLYVEELKKIYYDNKDKYGFKNVELNLAD